MWTFTYVANVRANPPVGVGDDELAKVLDTIESPRSQREEGAVREVFESSYLAVDT